MVDLVPADVAGLPGGGEAIQFSFEKRRPYGTGEDVSRRRPVLIKLFVGGKLMAAAESEQLSTLETVTDEHEPAYLLWIAIDKGAVLAGFGENPLRSTQLVCSFDQPAAHTVEYLFTAIESQNGRHFRNSTFGTRPSVAEFVAEVLGDRQAGVSLDKMLEPPKYIMITDTHFTKLPKGAVKWALEEHERLVLASRTRASAFENGL